MFLLKEYFEKVNTQRHRRGTKFSSRFFGTYANDRVTPVAGPHPTPAAQPLPLIIPTWSFERYTRTFVIYHGVNDQNF